MIQTLINLKNFFLFKKFLKNKFSYKNRKFSSKKILVEFNSLEDCYIPYSYLSNELSKKYNAKIYGFNDLKEKNILNLLKYFKLLINPFSRFSIYKSFGTKFLISFFLNNDKKKVDDQYYKIFNKIKTKTQFERLKINNILVGDLFYDTYLKKFRKPTIDLNSPEFRDFIYKELIKFYFWWGYIDKNIRAIIVSHTVYNLAVPLRICIYKKIESFQINWKQIYRLNKKKYMAYQEFKEFPKLFKKLNIIEKKNGIKTARNRIKMRINGIIGVDMPYSKKTAYSKNFDKSKKLLKKNKKIKILIPTHCFFDSPHSYGFNTFPDFYEWLDFLGKMTKKTDYDWYIKTHPDYLPGTLEIVKNFIERYPKIKLLPPNSSHNQLIKEGIDVVLTVYGTIGCEYPLLNKLVINASANNPHIGYNFNYHCSNKKRYIYAIKNLKKLIKSFKIDKNKVFEYYYMQHIYKFKNYFYSNLLKYKKNKDTYSYLLKSLKNLEEDELMKKNIENTMYKFVNGNEYYINM